MRTCSEVSYEKGYFGTFNEAIRAKDEEVSFRWIWEKRTQRTAG
jgi:hypothetical protein